MKFIHLLFFIFSFILFAFLRKKAVRFSSVSINHEITYQRKYRLSVNYMWSARTRSNENSSKWEHIRREIKETIMCFVYQTNPSVWWKIHIALLTHSTIDYIRKITFAYYSINTDSFMTVVGSSDGIPQPFLPKNWTQRVKLVKGWTLFNELHRT